MPDVPPPYAHQLDAVARAVRHRAPGFGLFLDTGTGKTRTALMVAEQLKAKRVLVVCPLSIIRPAWKADLERFYPQAPWPFYDFHAWRHKLKRPKPECFRPDRYLGCINYESFRTLAPHLLDLKPEVVFFDESSYLKNPRSQVTKAAIAFVDHLRLYNPQLSVYVLSGSPASDGGELDYWAQMRVTNPQLLGSSYYSFRNRFFYPSGYRGYDWKLLPSKRDALMALLRAGAIYVDKLDCLDLPSQVDVVREVEFDPAQARAYADLKDELAHELSAHEWTWAANAAAKLIRLRQLTSGFLVSDLMLSASAEDPIASTLSEAEVLRTTRWVSERKLTELGRVLDELGPRQAIIWYQFNPERDKLIALLKQRKARFGVLAGMTTPKQRDQAIEEFRAGLLQYLIAHPQVAGHGLTLVECHEAIYYSLSYSRELYKQSRDRLHRAGQRNKVTYHHLLCTGTIDEVVYAALQRKAQVEREILEHLRLSVPQSNARASSAVKAQ